MYTQIDGLITRGLAARSAHALYSKFAVGVAIRAAVAAGEGHFVAIAVTSDSHEPIAACRGYRQFLAEFNPDLIIVSATGSGDRKIDSPSRLLPDPFRGIPKNADLS